jgi:PP-loop superfamily ATP-utilizing enzyme
MKLVERLLLRTSNILDPHAANVVAYSGGVDSSLVAALVVRAFANYNHGQRQGSVQAVLGISPAVPKSQIIMARTVAKTIGIPLNEVSTSEGNDETYQKNEGYACFVCKTHLYSTLKTVANEAMKLQHTNGKEGLQHHQSSNPFILYNGTNADDTIDPTRLGLLAASNFSVHSPLDQITKDEVRQAAKYLNLPNWNAAASPCLRSRLAMGVMATKDHLLAVELAEEFVRNVLELDEK